MDAAEPTMPGTSERGVATAEWLPEINGLRAYLALWVVAGHVLWVSGFEREALPGMLRLIRTPQLAVDLFIIVSGFVIFLALDAARGGSLAFVVRRFFRLYPLFILLFFVAMPVSKVAIWNATHAAQLLPPSRLMLEQMEGWWHDVLWHVPLHLTMLHGLIPQRVLPNAPTAFLIPGWSISLEWQFYLVAPLAFAWATRGRWIQRVLLVSLCVYMMFIDHGEIPSVQGGAALPYHVEYFFLGSTSYLLFRRRAGLPRPGVWFALSAVAFLAVYSIREAVHWSVIPTMLWLLFLGVILESPASPVRRTFAPFLANPVTRFLGDVSYGIYLSHMIAIHLIQFVLLRLAPALERAHHAAALFAATVLATIAVAVVLRRTVELPGIALGRRVALGIDRRRVAHPGRLYPEVAAAVRRSGIEQAVLPGSARRN